MWPNPQETADFVTFTEEILTGKLHFLCGEIISNRDENRSIELFVQKEIFDKVRRSQFSS